MLCGYVGDGRVSVALSRVLCHQAELALVSIIRRIDSCGDAMDVARILERYGVPYAVVSGNVSVNRMGLHLLLQKKVLTGFDEIWLFDGVLPAIDLGRQPPCTSDSTCFADGVPEEVMRAVVGTHCVLLMADGCGLNYCGRDASVAEALMLPVE